MPWCTAILGFWRARQRAWIWPRLSGHGVTRVEAFTQSALITVSKTTELEKLGTWELVAVALQKTPLGPFWDGFVLPVLPQKISTIVFSIKKF